MQYHSNLDKISPLYTQKLLTQTATAKVDPEAMAYKFYGFAPPHMSPHQIWWLWLARWLKPA